MVKLSRANLFLKGFGILKIPLIAFVNPKIVEINSERVVVRIRKNWRTSNHLNSMYFGALAIGGDVAAGFLAFIKGKEMGVNPSLVFKDFKVSFIKRPESHVYFVCNNGKQLDAMLSMSKTSGDRVTETANILAYTHYYDNEKQELVAEMSLGVSVKVKSKS